MKFNQPLHMCKRGVIKFNFVNQFRGKSLVKLFILFLSFYSYHHRCDLDGRQWFISHFRLLHVNGASKKNCFKKVLVLKGLFQSRICLMYYHFRFPSSRPFLLYNNCFMVSLLRALLGNAFTFRAKKWKRELWRKFLNYEVIGFFLLLWF